MKLSVFTAACLLTIAAPSHAQSVSEKSGVNSLVGAAPKSLDFVKLVAMSDIFEIESSKLAEQQADASSKQFAAKMIKDHTATSSELKATAIKLKFDVPAALDTAHQGKIDKLKNLKGADFDSEYDTMQVDAHKDAVSLFDRYSRGGDNPELKAFALKHLPHLQEHLRMAQELSNKK